MNQEEIDLARWDDDGGAQIPGSYDKLVRVLKRAARRDRGIIRTP